MANEEGNSRAQIESHMGSFSVVSLPLSSEDATFTFKLTPSEILSLSGEEDLMTQKRLIKDMARELRGTELKEASTYKINDMLSLEENPEAMAQQLGIPQQMRAGLKDVGYLYHGTTPTGEEITVEHIGLEEAIKEMAEHLLPSVWQMIKELENELFGIHILSREVYAYRVNNELRIVESPEAMAQSLGLPEAELAALKDVDEQYHGRDIQSQDIAVKRVALYDAVIQLGEQLLSQKELLKDVAEAKDVESLDMLGQDSDMRLEDIQINQEGLNTQFELFLRNEKGRQIKKILAEVQDLKNKMTWEEKLWQESKYGEYMNQFTSYKRKIIYNYSKIDKLNKNLTMDEEGIIKNMNNILLAARVFLVEQHYRSFLETPQGQDIAQLESNQANDWNFVEQHCSLEVRRQVKRLTTAKYHFLREELVRAYIDPHVSDEQKRKCIDTLKAHIEETSRLMSEQIKSFSKNTKP